MAWPIVTLFQAFFQGVLLHEGHIVLHHAMPQGSPFGPQGGSHLEVEAIDILPYHIPLLVPDLEKLMQRSDCVSQLIS